MKKIIVLSVLMFFLVASSVYADEIKEVDPNQPVSSDVLHDEDIERELREELEAEFDGRVVGDDLDLKEGEMGIVSMPEESDAIDVVAPDVELEEGEMGIISIDDEPADESNSTVLVLVLIAALGLISFVVVKRKK